MRLEDTLGYEVSQLHFGQGFRVVFECEILRDLDDALFEVSISALDGTHVICSTTIDRGRRPVHLPRGRHIVKAEFDNVLLPRAYTIDLGVHHYNGVTHDFVQRTADFTVLKVAKNGDDHFRWDLVRGYARIPVRWTSAWPAGLTMPDQPISRRGTTQEPSPAERPWRMTVVGDSARPLQRSERSW